MLLPFPHGARCWIQIDSKRKPLWAPEAELSTKITPLISVGPPRLGFFSAEENDPQKYQAKAGIISFSSPLLLPWTWLALYEIFIATLCTYLKQEKIKIKLKLKLKNCGKYIYILCNDATSRSSHVCTAFYENIKLVSGLNASIDTNRRSKWAHSFMSAYYYSAPPWT
jgi:hypothetical protein